MMKRQGVDRYKMSYRVSICGLIEVSDVADSFQPTHIISITDPGYDPINFDGDVSALRLQFHDVDRIDRSVINLFSRQGRAEFPAIHHAQSILDFGKTIPPTGRVLIHCHAGISRSTAAAFLLACQHRLDAEAAYSFILSIRPEAMPNLLIVKYGDQILGAGGRMIACLDG